MSQGPYRCAKEFLQGTEEEEHVTQRRVCEATAIVQQQHEHRGTSQTHLEVRVSPWSPPYMSQRQSIKEAVRLKTRAKTKLLHRLYATGSLH